MLAEAAPLPTEDGVGGNAHEGGRLHLAQTLASQTHKRRSVLRSLIRVAVLLYTATAIRRLVDWRPTTISLVRLIEEIADHPEVLSRRRFVGFYRGHRSADVAHRHFERLARPGTDMVDPRLIRRHRRDLLEAHRRLRMFENKYVAHRDKRQMRRLPTYADLDRCVDVVEGLGKEFSFILKAEGTSVVPSMPYGWDKPFRVAWI